MYAIKLLWFWSWFLEWYCTESAIKPAFIPPSLRCDRQICKVLHMARIVVYIFCYHSMYIFSAFVFEY